MEPRQNVKAVSIDKYAGARMAVAHLLEQGYRQIGHISGPLDWWEARQRLAAWQDTLKEAGIAVTEEHGPRAIGHLRAARRRSSACCASTPRWTPCSWPTIRWRSVSCRRLASGGFGVPEALGVVGFDNMPDPPTLAPADDD